MPETKTTTAATTPAPAAKPKGPLDEKFKGKKSFFLGIQVDEKGNVPILNISIAGVVFQVFTQQPGTTESVRGRGAPKNDGSVWLTLSEGDAGDFQDLTYERLSRVLEAVPYYWARYYKGVDAETGESVVRRADVFNINEATMTKDPDKAGHFKQIGYRWNIEENDEPLARHLVILPADRLHEYGSRQDLDSLPSLEDLYPKLGEEPERK